MRIKPVSCCTEFANLGMGEVTPHPKRWSVWLLGTHRRVMEIRFCPFCGEALKNLAR